MPVPPGVPGHGDTAPPDVRVLHYRKPDGTWGYDETGRYEIICHECGDDLDVPYGEASPEIQRVRGPYYGLELAKQKVMEHIGQAPRY